MNRLLFLSLLIQFYGVAWSQSDTLTVLPVVNITEKQFEKAFQGNKVVTFDSLYHIGSISTNLGDLLTQKGFSFVKSYGQMQLQTISVGGANAGQTAVCWEGVPINNVMLGTADLSLVPFLFFSNVALYQGGTSVLSGGNSLGGAVNLNNKLQFQKSIGVKMGMDYSSLNNGSYFFDFNYSDKQFSTHTALSFLNGLNQIRYLNSDNFVEKIDTLPHAGYSGLALMTNNGFKLSNNQVIRFDLWYQKYFRNLPPILFEAGSDAFQYDEQTRGLLSWKRQGKISETEIKTAWFHSFMWYGDTMKSIDSHNSSSSFLAQAVNIWQFNQNTSLFVRGEWNIISVKTNNYLINKSRKIFASVMGFNRSLLRDKWKNAISARFETVDSRFSPPVFSYGSRIRILKKFSGKVNISKNYRLPTFNDLYWNPMGNPDLKPENGWSYQGGIVYLFSKEKWLIKCEVTGFYNDISDMILWKPKTVSYWSPINVGKVKTYGEITDLSVLYKRPKWYARLDADYTFTQAVNAGITDPNYGKFLMYVPDAQLKLNGFVSFYGFVLKYSQQLVSSVYINTDNEGVLPAYELANVILSKKIFLTNKHFGMDVYGGVDNLFNKNYQVMVARPMPLRYFKIGLMIYANK